MGVNPVPPYTGNQGVWIKVPRPIFFRQTTPEESCWVMIPYATLYPKPFIRRVAFVPPPVYRTDMWSANQTFPL